jgi:hypothetical protein
MQVHLGKLATPHKRAIRVGTVGYDGVYTS